MKLSLKTNLRLGLGLSLIILIASSFASYLSINNLISTATLVENNNLVMNDLDNAFSNLQDAETGQRGYLLTGDKVFLEPYTGAREKITALYEKIGEETKGNATQQAKLNELKEILDKRLIVIEKTIKAKDAGRPVLESELLDGKLYMDKVRQIVKEMQAEAQSQLALNTTQMDKFAGYTPTLVVLAAVLSLIITLFFYRKVSLDFNDRIKLQDQLAKKNEEIAQRIEITQHIAQQISNGDYSARLDEDTKDELNNLSVSLNAMAESLQYAFGKLADKEWMQSGIAELNNKMVGEKDIPTLSNDILKHLIAHTNSQVAALYVLNEDETLHLTGSYALNKGLAKRTFAAGESLVGQCLESRSLILLENITDSELTISYASGNTRPTTIVAFPITKGGIMIGVIELGALSLYTPLVLEFLNNISSTIGLAIQTAQNRRKLQEFLEETQVQAEELQSQHGELESLNAELEMQTQKLQASEEELRVQQEELLHSNQELEERSSLLEEHNQTIQERNIEIQQKAELLEQSTRYKSEFLANMSHELRTPLNSILLLSKLMADHEELDKEFTEYASVIQSSGNGLLSLIDEILDLSKIEAGKMTLEVAEVSLNEVITNLQALFKPIANDKQLSFEVNIADDTPPRLFTDQMRLEQVLKNLLSNAFKFTAKGKVSLEISSDPSQQTHLFKVKDTGVGISADKTALIFQAFQQADGSTRRKFGGTGLGLSISKELAILLGGDIHLESIVNVGSEFTLSIPFHLVDSNEMRETPDLLVEKEGADLKAPERFTVSHIPNEIEDDRENLLPEDKIILIIEDDTSFAKALLDFTRKRNYKGLIAVRGDVGIEMAKSFNPQAILLDIQLPVKDGWQVMEELKQDPKTRAIPVHIMSSLEVKKESLLKGAVDFIEKPYALAHMKAIFEKLEHVLNKHSKKVLIVEENEQHARALKYFLSDYDIPTSIARNVDESVSALQQKDIDCVILDMGAPNKEAYETLEVIKKGEGLANLPIIVFTGKNLSKGEESRIKQYADTIILKTAHSYQRILDEAGIFLHLIEEHHKKEQFVSRDENLKGLHQVLNGKTVLIADDDIRNIFSLTKALEQHKMNVLSALDGKEALKILIENPKVDIVLMDMMMPQMDGYESTKAIRKLAHYKQLPILAVTAKAMMGDREKCIEAGASDYISKPVDMDQLISLLRVWLYDKS